MENQKLIDEIIESLSKNKVDYFFKGKTSYCNTKTISVSIGKQVVEAKNINVVVPGEVNVVYDAKSNTYSAWSETPGEPNKNITTIRNRRTRYRSKEQENICIVYSISD